MIKLLIFDLDGTLLDTIDDLARGVNFVLKKYGHPVHPRESYRYFVGNGIRELLRRALPETDRDDSTIERLRIDFIDYYARHDTDGTKPYDGITELIDTLKSRGYRMAVASNKFQSATDRLSRHFFGDETFDVILGQREGVAPKPDPAIVLDILRETGCTVAESLYIGDSGVDMQTAAACGITSVGVTWGFRPREELIENGAGYVIDHPSAILKIIASSE